MITVEALYEAVAAADGLPVSKLGLGRMRNQLVRLTTKHRLCGGHPNEDGEKVTCWHADLVAEWHGPVVLALLEAAEPGAF